MLRDFDINSVSPLRGGTAAHGERRGRKREDGGREERKKKGRDGEEQRHELNPPCGSLHPFFIGDLCFI